MLHKPVTIRNAISTMIAADTISTITVDTLAILVSDTAAIAAVAALRRVIQSSVEDVLSEGILGGTFHLGDTVLIDYQDGEITLEVTDRQLDAMQRQLEALWSAIEDAMETAVSATRANDATGNRPLMIAFLTDGLPTIGERDPERLARIVAERGAWSRRDISPKKSPAFRVSSGR